MWGVLLASLGTLFEEAGAVIGKVEVQKRKESEYTMGFLSLFWVTIVFLCIAIIVPSSFVFSLASLPFLAARVLFEIFQIHLFVHATISADRSSFGFLRTSTIPLLLIVDLVIGYTIGFRHLIGIGVIVLTIVVLFLNHGIRKKGSFFVMLASVNPVITVSLYKYNITHFNSVVAEQTIVHIFTCIYFLLASWYIAKEHPFRMMKNKIFFGQSAAYGVGSAIASFAYLFAPPSVIMAVRRSSAILWSVISGNKVFHEHHALLKLAAFVLLAVGVVLLV